MQFTSKILREEDKLCKNAIQNMVSVDVSAAAATDLVNNVTVNPLCDKVCVPVKGSRSNMIYVDQQTEEKAPTVSAIAVSYGRCQYSTCCWYNLSSLQPSKKQISYNTQQQTMTRNQL